MSKVVYADFGSEKRQQAYQKLQVGNIIPHELRVMEAVANSEFATIDLRNVRSVLAVEPFLLDDSFTQEYVGKEPEWGELGWFTFKRTYARRVEYTVREPKYKDNAPPSDMVADLFETDGNGNILYEERIESKRTEEWTEVVRRVVEGNMNIIQNDPVVTQAYAQGMYKLIWNLVWTPPGRGLWMSGSEFAKRSGDAMNNCWFVATRPWNYGETNKIFTRYEIDPNRKYVSYPFIFLFDQAMKGGGVGWSAEEKDLTQLPEPENRVNTYFYLDETSPDFPKLKALSEKLGFKLNVPYHVSATNDIVELSVADSREGWAEAGALAIDLHYNGGKDVDYIVDLSAIRVERMPIRGFGGVAAGCMPLAELLNFYVLTFNKFIGKKLTSEAVADLHCATGRCVVAGNVRRTAEVGLASPYDKSFINLKNYRLYEWCGGWRPKEDNPDEWEFFVHDDEYLLAKGIPQADIDDAKYQVWAQNNHRWASNNSVVVDDPRGYNYGFISVGIQVNGEPGTFNRWLAQNFGRIIDGFREMIDPAEGGNPCMEIDLVSTEPCNLVETMLPIMHKLGIDFAEVAPYMVHYAKRVTFSNFDWESSREVISQNRRIGISLAGFMDWVLLRFGKAAITGWKVYKLEDWHDMVWLDDDAPHALFPGNTMPSEDVLAEWYVTHAYPHRDHKRHNRARKYFLRKAKREGYQQYYRLEPVYNEELVAELDRMYKIVVQADIEYSALLTKALGFEVKPSIKRTTVKPGGTTPLLPGVSPGGHAHYFRWGIRRIRVQQDDALLKLAQQCGYHTEPDLKTPSSWVIDFPFEAPSAHHPDFRSVAEISIEEQFAMQSLLSVYWSDNMVSCTITFHEHERKVIKPLLEQYRMRIKSTSLLPYAGHGYLQAPYEPKDYDWYVEAKKNIIFKPQDLYHMLMNTGEFTDREMELAEAIDCMAKGVCGTRG